jgi:hypothetical protein
MQSPPPPSSSWPRGTVQVVRKPPEKRVRYRAAASGVIPAEGGREILGRFVEIACDGGRQARRWCGEGKADPLATGAGPQTK